MIKNEQTYKLPNHHYKTFSQHHRLTVDKKVQNYYEDLKQFYNMTEIQRTDLLNYLNNNKITYLFDSSNQTIIVNLEVNE